MEGYLIRVPLAAWSSSDTKKRQRNGRGDRERPQATLLYYVLGEGFLRGYRSHEHLDDPVETFQLTSHQIHVEPIYSMHMIEVTTWIKGPYPPRRDLPSCSSAVESRRRASRHASRNESGSDDEDDNASSSGDSSADDSDHPGPMTIPIGDEQCFLLFAGDRQRVDAWGNRLLNWNRYVFGGFDETDEPSPEALAQAKTALVQSFQDLNSNGMFTTRCDLVLDGGKRESPMTARAVATFDAMDHVNKPPEAAAENHRPWWMFMQRGPSRRISAVPLRK